jgi:hypothetical protein
MLIVMLLDCHFLQELADLARDPPTTCSAGPTGDNMFQVSNLVMHECHVRETIVLQRV